MTKIPRQEITIYSIPKVHVAVYREAATLSGFSSVSAWLRNVANTASQKQCPRMWDASNRILTKQKDAATPLETLQQEKLEANLTDTGQKNLDATFIETPFNPTSPPTDEEN